MTETAPSVEEQSPSSEVQIGDLTAKLVECREQAGLDIEQAAEELHLSKHILYSLEAEDFAKLPEPPYVRGYLRGYAKLADTDPRELIRVYEALRGAEPDDIAHHFAPARPLHTVTQPAISSSTIKFIGFGALVLLLGIISMIPGVREWATHTWSAFSAQTNPPEVPETVTRPPSAMEAFAAQKAAREKAAEEQKAAEQQRAQAAAAATSGNNTANPVATTSEADTNSQTPAATAVATATPQSGSADNAAASATAQAASTDASGTPADETAQATTTETTAEADSASAGEDPTDNAATPPIAGEVSVKLEFSEEVWMQVKDSDDRKTLFEALNSAGAIKEFKAQTPLDFKVGNAQGVKIYLNGQLYDQAPHTKGSVARFKVE